MTDRERWEREEIRFERMLEGREMELADRNPNRNCCNDPDCPVWGDEYLNEHF